MNWKKTSVTTDFPFHSGWAVAFCVVLIPKKTLSQCESMPLCLIQLNLHFGFDFSPQSQANIASKILEHNVV